MPDYVCLIQQGQQAERKRRALEEGLLRIGQDCFGDPPGAVEVAWSVVESGYAWTAGKPSTTSLVIRSVPVGLPADERAAFLHRVCDLWVGVTGCSINEIVATAFDGPLPISG